MKQTEKSSCACMICGGRREVLQEGEIVLCARCLEALQDALEEKLPRHGRKKPCEGIEKPLLLW